MEKVFLIIIEPFSYSARTSIGQMRFEYEGEYPCGERKIIKTFFGYTLEDTIRPANVKVHGETAIPRGIECFVRLYDSPKFGPTIMFYTEPDKVTIKAGSLTFKYAEVHGGNTHDDTDSCVIVAKRIIDRDTIQGSLQKELRIFIEQKIKEGYVIKARFAYLPQLDNSLLNSNLKTKAMTKDFWKDLTFVVVAVILAILTIFIINRVEKRKTALPSKTYYVSVGGSDIATGTITSPFATWQKGFSMLTPGDTLYIRGGTYKPTGVNTNNVYLGYAGVYVNGKSGTAANPIVVRSYKNEVPVLDCINMRQSSVHIGVCLFNVSYWKLYGLTVMNAKQMSGQKSSPGFLGYNINNSVFEKLVGHDNGGSGICIKWESDQNLILNCDGYNNADPYTGGDDADGIEVAFIQYRAGTPRTNTIKGCRGWHNSDDGYDFYSNDGILIIESNWAWRNGAYMGIGSGIKVGNSKRTEYAAAGIVQRIVKNNISAFNDAYGFANNNMNGIVHWYNNISFHNVSPSSSYASYGYERWHNNYKSVFKNNISLEDQNTISGLGTGTGVSEVLNNSWQNGVAVRGDFVSVDTAQLKLPRKPNGDLPDITAFHLTPNSKFVDAGVNVGLPFAGKAPDLGPFEVIPYVPPVEPPVDTIIIPPVDTVVVPPVSNDTIYINSIDTVYLKVRKGTKVIITN